MKHQNQPRSSFQARPVRIFIQKQFFVEILRLSSISKRRMIDRHLAVLLFAKRMPWINLFVTIPPYNALPHAFWFAIFSGISAGIGLMIGLWLLSVNPDERSQELVRSAYLWLAVVIFAITILKLEDLFFYSPYLFRWPNLMYSVDWLMFLLGPFAYQYIRIITAQGTLSGRAWVAHSLLAVLSITIFVIFYYDQPYDVKVKILNADLTNAREFNLANKLDSLATIQWIFYFGLSSWTVRNYRRRLSLLVPKPYFAALRLGWLDKWLYAVVALVSVEALYEATRYLFFEFLTTLAPTLGLYVVGLIHIRQPRVFNSSIMRSDSPVKLPSPERASETQYYSCFISYSSKNQDFADYLYVNLVEKGVDCWFAPEDLKIGDKFRQRIDDAIRLYDKLLVILSRPSVDSSWVEQEVESALAKEQQSSKLVLFPLRIDDAVMTTNHAWAATLKRTRHIGDFSNWQDGIRFQAALERLLRDLKAESKEL